MFMFVKLCVQMYIFPQYSFFCQLRKKQLLLCSFDSFNLLYKCILEVLLYIINNSVKLFLSFFLKSNLYAFCVFKTLIMQLVNNLF
jgi:hypothetical protein